VDEAEDFAAEVRGFAASFINDMGQVRSWTGIDDGTDEYAKNAIPLQQKNERDVYGMLNAIADTVLAATNGRFEELRIIAGAQGWAEEQVNDLMGKTRNVGNGDSGAGNGGRR
jgi:hypothetical protein